MFSIQGEAYKNIISTWAENNAFSSLLPQYFPHVNLQPETSQASLNLWVLKMELFLAETEFLGYETKRFEKNT